MGEQPNLIRLPRRPSLTAATTRAARKAAREWAATKGFETWAKNERTCADVHSERPILGSTIGGILIPRPHNPIAGPLVLCWDCVPYPGAPLRNHEWWGGNQEGDDCVRCHRSMEDRGGIHSAGGPFCWDCGSPDRDVHAAWLLTLRTDPAAPMPWAGDKAVTHG